MKLIISISREMESESVLTQDFSSFKLKVVDTLSRLLDKLGKDIPPSKLQVQLSKGIKLSLKATDILVKELQDAGCLLTGNKKHSDVMVGSDSSFGLGIDFIGNSANLQLWRA